MKITVQSGDASVITENDKPTISFGEVGFGNGGVSTTIFVAGEYDSFRTSTSCGCTAAQPVKVEGGYEIEVTYKNTHVKKPFAKSVFLYYRTDGKKKETKQQVRVTGTVK